MGHVWLCTCSRVCAYVCTHTNWHPGKKRNNNAGMTKWLINCLPALSVPAVYVCLSISVYVCPSTAACLCLSFIFVCLFPYLSIFMSVSVCLYLFVCICLFMFVYLCLSNGLLVYSVSLHYNFCQISSRTCQSLTISNEIISDLIKHLQHGKGLSSHIT